MIHETANIYKTAKLGVNVKVGAFSEVGHNVRIHDNVSIGYGVFVPENVEIMKNTFVGPGTVFTNDKYAPSKGKWREEITEDLNRGADKEKKLQRVLT